LVEENIIQLFIDSLCLQNDFEMSKNNEEKNFAKITALQKAAKEYISGPLQCKYSSIKKIFFLKKKKLKKKSLV